jgi:HD-GYP domain-containing protein (c-di-GMP phosphodiesterase class II)
LGEAKGMGHGWRVAHRATQTLEAAGERAGAEVAVAGLLHDVGVSSVAYGLYERLGGRERSLLVGYPSLRGADGLDGLLDVPDAAIDPKADRDAARFVLERHAEVGAGMVRALGYGDAVAALVASHHAFDGHPFAQALAVSDRVETALGAGDDPSQIAAQLDALKALGLSAAIADAARATLARDADLSASPDADAEATLDRRLEGTLDLWADEGEVEAHLRLLAQVVDSQSPFMAGHTLDVTRLGRRMGEHLGLSSHLLDDLALAGLVHGVGRLGLPASILEKSGCLSEEEFITLHTYPNLTRAALAPLTPLHDIIDAASTHREKLDGSGYPEGRRDAEIPLIGRVLAVADTYNALICDRPYRSGYGRSRALAILRAEGTRLFDGLVLDALEAVCREGF